MTPAYLYVYASVDVGLKCRRSNGIDKSDTLILFLFFSLRFVRVVCLWCVGGVCVCSGFGLGIFYFIFFG